MIQGETVEVFTYEEVGRDEHNNPIRDWVSQGDVENVLVIPGPREDLPEANRPDGVRIQWTLHFPHEFTGSLRGAKVKVRDDEPRPVVGDPMPYQDANTPGPWNRPVELSGTDG